MDGESFFKLLSSKSTKKSYKSKFEFYRQVGKELGQEQSFFTFDLADILWKTQLWRENLPDVDPFFAIKANADPVLLRLFVLLGYGFDCSTEGEMRLALNAGADPKRIIFAHTVKTRRALKFASAAGVELMTFDSEEELLKIHKIYPSARLVLRLKSASSQTVYNLSRKFGADVSGAEPLLLRAKELQLNVVGVSFHVEGLCDDPGTFTTSIEDSRAVFDVAERCGFQFNIVNIGAGFFGSKEREQYFLELSREISTSLRRNFPEEGVLRMAEPGCFCVCSAVTLTTAIIGKKTKVAGDMVEKEYYLNDGFYGSFFEHNEIYDVKHKPILTPSQLRQRGVFRSKLWGLTCCSEDVIREECLLPDMEEEELIVWENMGAYSRGCCSTFTTVPYPDERHVFVRNTNLRLDWIPNLKEVSEFLADVATLVENEELDDIL